jgi:hypothetical protein
MFDCFWLAKTPTKLQLNANRRNPDEIRIIGIRQKKVRKIIYCVNLGKSHEYYDIGVRYLVFLVGEKRQP